MTTPHQNATPGTPQQPLSDRDSTTTRTQPASVRRTGYHRDTPVEELERFRDNPHQRYTPGRAGSASAGHLAVLEAPHLEINVVLCKEDQHEYMLDGHTRRHVWLNKLQDDPTQRPDRINLITWEADTIDDVVALYQMCDAREAVKSVGDEVYGSMRELHMSPVSQQLIKGSWLNTALRTIAELSDGRVGVRSKKGFDFMGALESFRTEISLLDDLRFGDKVEVQNDAGESVVIRHPKLTSSQATAALFILARDKEAALPFLEAVRDRQGSKYAQTMDPVYAAYEWHTKSLERERMKNNKRNTAADLAIADMEVFINAYEAWRVDPQSELTTYPMGNKAARTALVTFHPYAARARKH